MFVCSKALYKNVRLLPKHRLRVLRRDTSVCYVGHNAASNYRIVMRAYIFGARHICVVYK